MGTTNNFDEFCDDELISRAKLQNSILISTYNKMAKSPPYSQQNRIALNMSFLMHACISCEIDIKRWTPFHKIKIPKNFKKAAFLFKWISRMRPVRPIAGYGNESPSEMAANAYFALLAALGELDVDIETFGDSCEIKELIYSSTYRDIHPESWAITFSLLEKAFPLKTG